MKRVSSASRDSQCQYGRKTDGHRNLAGRARPAVNVITQTSTGLSDGYKGLPRKTAAEPSDGKKT